MGGGIFISYRRDDSAPYARLISDALGERFGEEMIFRDIDTIRPGTNFVQAIERAVSSCQALIVVIGKDWVTISDSSGQRRLDDPEDYVRLEVLAGLRRDDVLVVPVLVEGAGMPRKEELPPELVPLPLRMALELSDTGWDYQLSHLVDVLTGAIDPEIATSLTTHGGGRRRPPDAKPDIPSRLASWGRRRLLVTGGVLVTVLLVTVLLVALIVGSRNGDDYEQPLPGAAGLSDPQLIAVDAEENLYIADRGNHRIVRVAADKSVTSVAGTGQQGEVIEGIPATDTPLDQPEAVLLRPDGALLIREASGRLLAMSPDRTLRTVDRVGRLSPSVTSLTAVATAPVGLLYLATDTRVLSLDPKTGELTPVAGTETANYSGDGAEAVRAQLNGVKALAVDRTGAKLYIADCGNGRIRQVDLVTNLITTFAGRPGDRYLKGGLATETDISCPQALAVSPISDDVYVTGDNVVYRIADQRIEVVAGNKDPAAPLEDGKPATSTNFRNIKALAVDDRGRIYLTDGNQVRLIDENGIVRPYA